MLDSMFRRLQPGLILTGRIFLGAVFLMTATGQLAFNFSKVSGDMQARHVPLPAVMLVAGIVFLLAGSLSIIIGFRARIGAGLLFVFLALASYYMHAFWKL